MLDIVSCLGFFILNVWKSRSVSCLQVVEDRNVVGRQSEIVPTIAGHRTNLHL